MRRRISKRRKRSKGRSFSRTPLIGVLSGVGIAVGLAYFFLFSSFFQVTDVELINATEEEIFYEREEGRERKILTAVSSNLSRSVAGKETRSIFLTPFSQIEEELLRNFPYLRDVSFAREFPRSLRVSFFERIPVGAVSAGENVFFLVDKEGVAFFRTSSSWGFLILERNPKKEVKEGVRFIEKEKLRLIRKAASLLDEQGGVSAERVRVNAPEEAFFFTEEGWYVIVNLQGDLSLQAEKLAQALPVLSKEEREGMDYMDVRFSRVYYQ